MTGALGELLRDALIHGGRISDAATGKIVPAHDLLEQAHTVATGLRQLGIAQNEPVHVRVGNRPGDLAALLGVWLATGVAVPIHVDAAPRTVEIVGSASGARLMVDGTAVDVIAADPPPQRELLQGAALIIFTSGTTGQPKGVVISHEALAGKIVVLDGLLALRPDDIVLLPLHLIFIFGIWAAILALRSGSRLQLVQKFSKQAVEDGLFGGATVLAAVPSMLRALLAGKSMTSATLRMVLTGGEALGASLGQQLHACWPVASVYDLYGSTETGSCDFWHQPTSENDGLIGNPTENVQFKILDSAGSEVLVGEPGELAIRTSYGMAGYLDNPELTHTSFTADFYRTGDLACARTDGSVSLVGRLKELVSQGGNKIAPQEIDNLLCTHPGVAASLSAGRPDDRLGETLHSVIVLCSSTTLTGDELRSWLSGRVERFKVPKTIRIVDELPTGPTGKASRAALKSLLVQELIDVEPHLTV